MSSTETPRDPSRRFFRYLWAIWALFAVALIVPFASAQGHPPGFVFIPLVVVGWLIGHLVIWAFAILTRRLSGWQEGAPSTAPASPPSVWIAKVLLGIVFLGGTGFLLFLVLGALFWGSHSPGSFWFALVVVWSLHGVALVGALADTSWSRLLTPLVFACWVIALLVVGARLVDSGSVWGVLGFVGAGLAVWLVRALWIRRSKTAAPGRT